jgi:hypothetical protein
MHDQAARDPWAIMVVASLGFFMTLLGESPEEKW